MKILGMIPAREGSKGIKNKNLVKFKGKPLIFHSIKVAKTIKAIIPFVSTDSKKIKKYSEKNGIKFDYLRPKSISKDKSNIVDAVFHALEWFENTNVYFDAVMLLQPTSPLRKEKDVKKIIRIFKTNKKFQSIMTVSQVREHPYKIIKIRKKNWKFIETNKNNFVNRQEYPQNYFVEDGNIYLARVSFLKKNRSFVIKNKTKLYKSSHPLIDINIPIDLKIANLF